MGKVYFLPRHGGPRVVILKGFTVIIEMALVVEVDDAEMEQFEKAEPTAIRNWADEPPKKKRKTT